MNTIHLDIGLAPGFPPPQLEINTPFAPTAFPSRSRLHLLYELHLQNFDGNPLTIESISVLDAGPGVPVTITELGIEALNIQPVGDWPQVGITGNRYVLPSGRRIVVCLMLSLDSAVPVPSKLRHRVHLETGVVDGPAVDVRTTGMPELAPPVAGNGWLAASGPGHQSHHRNGLLVVDGVARLSRRYAIDWKKNRNGRVFSGDARNVGSYYTHGERVYSVADGTVVAALDGLPDNIPRTATAFETAVPITMETVAGNFIIIAVGDGQFACYAHLLASSLAVRRGDRVARGQYIGRIGNSGDAREPHLHFQLANAPSMLGAEGLPYVIDRYDAREPHGGRLPCRRELPLLGMVVDFGPAAG